MKFGTFSICLVLVFLTSCKKGGGVPLEINNDGVIISMPYVWNTPLSDGEWIEGVVSEDAKIAGEVILPSQRGNRIFLTKMFSDDGEIGWEWDDYFDVDSGLSIQNQAVYANEIIFSIGRRLYCVDLMSGATKWKTDVGHVISDLVNVGGEYFYSANHELDETDGLTKGVIRRGNFETSETSDVVFPNYEGSIEGVNGDVGKVAGIAILENGNGGPLLQYIHRKTIINYTSNVYTSLYDVSQDTHVYKSVPVAENLQLGVGKPVIHENKVYCNVGRSIVCLDVSTGEKRWSHSLLAPYGFSDFTFSGNKLIINSEESFIYAYHTDTGQQLWKETSSGTASRPQVLNGVVYFTGGGDGLLHAVDISTGEHLWKIRSPDLDDDDGAWFMRRVSVRPPAPGEEKGRVIVSSYLSAFCYEAAR